MFDKSFNFIKKIKRNLFPFYKNKEIQFIFDKLHDGYPPETIVAIGTSEISSDFTASFKCVSTWSTASFFENFISS